MTIDKNSWFYKNCKSNRLNESKCCNECPFRKEIEEQETSWVNNDNALRKDKI